MMVCLRYLNLNFNPKIILGLDQQSLPNRDKKLLKCSKSSYNKCKIKNKMSYKNRKTNLKRFFLQALLLIN